MCLYHKQDEKTTLRMGENICKQSNWQRINLQNIQAVHTSQYQKTQQRNQKMFGGFPGGTVVENLPANAGDTGSSPGLGRSHMPWSN